MLAIDREDGKRDRKLALLSIRTSWLIKYSIKGGSRRRSRRNVYLLKIEAKSFRDARQDIVRIQKVIWDHLLAFKGEIIKKQALFSLPFRTPNNSPVVLIYAVCSVFSFVLFSTSPRSFFRLNHVRTVWN